MRLRALKWAVLVGILTTPCAAQTPGPVPKGDRDCPHCPEMVRIPFGSFLMGSPPGEAARENAPPDWAKRELPRRKVTLAYVFSLGKHEVTRGEFAAFARATGHRSGAYWTNPDLSRHPVVAVTWDDAQAYVAWLSQTTGKRYRLPSEAEWEYAARAGTTTPRYWGERHQDGCRFAKLDRTYHRCQDGRETTAPVGEFQPNDFGLYDMLGNASEWTEDCWSDSYAGAPSDGSAWRRSDCDRRVVRGGSWGDGPWFVRAAAREEYAPNIRNNAIGFRVARTD